MWAEFTAWYGTRHRGRQLRTLHHMSKCEVVTNCFKNRYVITVSAYQSAVLEVFNVGQASVSVKEIMVSGD